MTKPWITFLNLNIEETEAVLFVKFRPADKDGIAPSAWGRKGQWRIALDDPDMGAVIRRLHDLVLSADQAGWRYIPEARDIRIWHVDLVRNKVRAWAIAIMYQRLDEQGEVIGGLSSGATMRYTGQEFECPEFGQIDEEAFCEASVELLRWADSYAEKVLKGELCN